MEKHKKHAMMAVGFGVGFLIGFKLYKERSGEFGFKSETKKILKEAVKLENKIIKNIEKRKNRIENYIE